MVKPEADTLGVSNPNPACAGFEVRVVAFLLDIIVLVSVLVLLVAAGGLQALIRGNFGAVDPPDSAFYVWAGFILAFIPISALYHTLLLVWRGQTLGKIAVHIRVVRPDGGRLTLGQSFVRSLGYPISALPLFLGFLVAFKSANRRTLHDMIAGTMVVRES